MFSWLARTHVGVPQYDGMGYSLIGYHCNSSLIQDQEHMFYDVYCIYDSNIYGYSPVFRRREESTMMCFTNKIDQFSGVRF